MNKTTLIVKNMRPFLTARGCSFIQSSKPPPPSEPYPGPHRGKVGRCAGLRKVWGLRIGIFLLLALFPMSPSQVGGNDRHTLQTKEVIVIFDEPLKRAAQEVLNLFPRLKRDLEEGLAWPFRGIITVLLVDDRLEFQKMVGHKLIVAIAIPQRNLIVIDFPRANARPFSLASILKHEMCHLLLHQHIKSPNLPRWLDEGICQWMSDGMAEIILEQNNSELDSAALTNRLISMRRLNHAFPKEEQALRLAYEQSKSLVSYMNGRLGKTGIMQILDQLKQGIDLDTSVLNIASISFGELEEQWQESLEKKSNWFSYFAKNLYLFLFFLAALITIAAFVRLIIRKKKYMADMD